MLTHTAFTQYNITPTRLHHCRRMTPADVRDVVERPDITSTTMSDNERADLHAAYKLALQRQQYRHSRGCVCALLI